MFQSFEMRYYYLPVLLLPVLLEDSGLAKDALINSYYHLPIDLTFSPLRLGKLGCYPI